MRKIDYYIEKFNRDNNLKKVTAIFYSKRKKHKKHYKKKIRKIKNNELSIFEMKEDSIYDYINGL